MTKTPHNPCPRAVARVRDRLPPPEECHYCGGNVRMVHHDELYGRVYGQWPWAYMCGRCRAYVGMHPKTNIPLGVLADFPTREARKLVKPMFEKLWRDGHMPRSIAYAALAREMDIPKRLCHFGWFDVDLCDQATAAVNRIAGELGVQL